MIDYAAIWEIVGRTLTISSTAVLIAALLGVPIGASLGLRNPKGHRWITAFIYTGMGLPPVVVGLAVYLLLSRQGIFGALNWLFTPAAMITAQTILAIPLIIGITMSTVRDVDPDLALQLKSLGATNRQISRTILYEARNGVLLSLVAGFGAAISEVGAVMMVGGNVAGRTRVLTTAIVLETRQGNFNVALTLGAILLTAAFLINLIAVLAQRN